MKTFWRSVLLRSGEYSGQPVPVHLAIEEIRSEDFGRWLKLFEDQVTLSFEPEAAELVMEAAQRIAFSLWMSRRPSLFDAPPDWHKAGSA